MFALFLAIGVWLFAEGFLLTRTPVDRPADWGDIAFGVALPDLTQPLAGHPADQPVGSMPAWKPLPLLDTRHQCPAHGAALHQQMDHLAGRLAIQARRVLRPFDRVIVLLVDALRYDFADANFGAGFSAATTPLPALHTPGRLLDSQPDRTMLRQFIADAPTTTLQRLKALNTGGLPAFVEAGSNFAARAVGEDSLPDAWRRAGRAVRFVGDDTWVGLFPEGRLGGVAPMREGEPPQPAGRSACSQVLALPSFDVADLDTVDAAVIRYFARCLELHDPDILQGFDGLAEWVDHIPVSGSPSWDVLIGHMLGLDHVGHRLGPHHPSGALERKIHQVERFLQALTSAIPQLPGSTALLVLGDHGMTVTGDHGGDTLPETTSALWVWAPSGGAACDGRAVGLLDEAGTCVPPPVGEPIFQTDYVPTLALLTGVPIPFSSLGVPIEGLFTSSHTTEAAALRATLRQVVRFLSHYAAPGGSQQQQQRQQQQQQQLADAPEALATDRHPGRRDLAIKLADARRTGNPEAVWPVLHAHTAAPDHEACPVAAGQTYATAGGIPSLVELVSAFAELEFCYEVAFTRVLLGETLSPETMLSSAGLPSSGPGADIDDRPLARCNRLTRTFLHATGLRCRRAWAEFDTTRLGLGVCALAGVLIWWLASAFSGSAVAEKNMNMAVAPAAPAHSPACQRGLRVSTLVTLVTIALAVAAQPFSNSFIAAEADVTWWALSSLLVILAWSHLRQGNTGASIQALAPLVIFRLLAPGLVFLRASNDDDPSLLFSPTAHAAGLPASTADPGAPLPSLGIALWDFLVSPTRQADPLWNHGPHQLAVFPLECLALAVALVCVRGDRSVGRALRSRAFVVYTLAGSAILAWWGLSRWRDSLLSGENAAPVWLDLAHLWPPRALYLLLAATYIWPGGRTHPNPRQVVQDGLLARLAALLSLCKLLSGPGVCHVWIGVLACIPLPVGSPSMPGQRPGHSRDRAPLHQGLLGGGILSFLALHLFFKTGHQTVFASIQWWPGFIGLHRAHMVLSGGLICMALFGAWVLRAHFLAAWFAGPGLEASDAGARLRVTSAAACAIDLLAIVCTVVATAILRRHLFIWSVFAPRFVIMVLAHGAGFLTEVFLGAWLQTPLRL
ncbi:hypothetical protein H696_04398 [Fonticula alba]|uniref:Uncharacterized protein n=1 Tax=Fonticula alba TaxID=691883 RepID=A0A058Z3Z4_FONAL|nr:hypothetical protein H696_04398 [Fonticula alba]KCV68979.1 hypothetical protein H696_04398 [Fonticula alba]|eukprot:XP_009496550.1 hypothetical protein H696_04398 [Fonticula alba]